jgi:quinoprotein glucose dehydrogenase
MRYAVPLFLAALLPAVVLVPIPDAQWPAYGRDPGGSKYSPLKKIDRSNVGALRVAWMFHAGDMYVPAKGRGGRQSAFESTPLYVDGVLYVTTAFGRLIALDPDSGRQKWAFDPKTDVAAGWGDFANRGAATWADPRSKRRRLYVATIDARLVCIDSETGKPCADFGTSGIVDLRTGLRNPPHYKAEYEETSPPAVINDLVVVGSGIADNGYTDAASGEVRAFDARSGQLRWTWDPMPGQQTGAANAWSIISVDPERNLLFVPTGSASPDYFGGERPGDNLYADSVVALRAATGERAWYFQTVHHDLWDYDVASQPALITIRKDGKSIPVVAAGSKTGNLFILDRVTGKPVFGFEERPVPKSDIPGEMAASTQPFPLMPKPLVSQAPLKPEDVFGATEEDRKFCADEVRKLRSDGIFTPPSVNGSLIRPGNIGGMHWGGVAFDPNTNLLAVPTNELVAEVKLIPRDQFDEEAGKEPGYEYARQRGTPYGMMRRFLRAPSGAPCGPPPWGTLSTIDMNTGELKWKVPLGGMSDVIHDPRGAKLGSPNLGGPIVTAGGLIFMGGTFDSGLHAFDIETGKELWHGDLPASARATPMTYESNGKQYVVIAAGGFDVPGMAMSDSLVAFTLP